MKINDEEIDLRLALGSSYYTARTRLNRSSGAGVNAVSKVNMEFAASDPLSELVWSPHRGLSLKCADSSLANKKPFDLWKAGLIIRDPAALSCIKSDVNRDGKAVDEEILIRSQAMLDGDDKSGDKATLLRSPEGSSGHEVHTYRGQDDGGGKHKMEEGGATDALQAENTRDSGEDMISSHNVQIVDIAESSKKNAEHNILADEICDNIVEVGTKWESSNELNRRTHGNGEDELEFDASSSGLMGLALPIRSEPDAVKISEAPIDPLPNAVSQKEPDEEVTSLLRDVSSNNTGKPNSIPEPILIRVESSAENISGHLVTKETHNSNELRISRENSCPTDGSPADRRIHLYKEKGKAKALSDGNIYGKSDDEDDSNNSMESCNSIGVLSKGKKRLSDNQDQLVGSKRWRKQIQGIHDSTSYARLESSFMNWISNMVKGLSDSNKDVSSLPALSLAHSSDAGCINHHEDFMFNKPLDSESPQLGFQTMFQSLYSQNTKILCSGIQKDDCTINESKELAVSEDRPLKNVPRLCDKNNDNTCKQIILCDKENNGSSTDFASTPYARESLAKNKSSDFPIHDGAKGEVTQFGSCKVVNTTAENAIIDTPVPISCMPAKGSPLTSLWITRLYTKQLEKGNQVTEEVPEHFPAASVGFNSTCEPIPVHSGKLRTSEAMSSVFAKRLDAFRHITRPPDKKKSPTSTQICFFCGSNSHHLQTCPELTETELNDLTIKFSAFDRVEGSPSFCVRCFQFDHWASSCPSVCSQIPSQSQRNAFSDHTSHLQLHGINDGAEENDHKQVSASLAAPTLDTLRRRLPTSNEFQKGTKSNSENDLKSMQKFLSFSFIRLENAAAQKEMFNAITKLRLTRSAVLRWMDSNVSLSHLNGFFLRLRVGRSETGLSGTGYYAARITGDRMEYTDSKNKKSILVDVGGIKLSIGSQYVSNHDFLEDEVKAWWSRMAKTTGGSIPSLDELNSMFEERKCLGL